MSQFQIKMQPSVRFRVGKKQGLLLVMRMEMAATLGAKGRDHIAAPVQVNLPLTLRQASLSWRPQSSLSLNREYMDLEST